MTRVEQFEQIRRDRAREGMSIGELARRHGVHRRAVRQALRSAVPPPKRPPRSRPAPKLGPYRPIIDEWLRDDQEAPRKQRHTARRIWQRLTEEHGAKVSERQVDRYVAAKRREIGEVEACVPLVSDAGVEAEVDWGEAQVIVRGEPVDVHLFLMRACHSGASFVAAFHSETQQAFLEGHVAALEFFGGAFDLVRYDNLKAAVAKVMKGRQRTESDRFVALRFHYGFDSSFCISGQQGAHEKGGVESEVGRFRRRHLVPVPKVESITELNERLEAACWADLERTIVGRREPVGVMLDRERQLLAPLPAEPHCTAEEASPRVDSKAMVTIRQNRYSVPARLAGMKVRAKVGAREIAIWHDGAVVATHERLASHHGASAQLEHYLDLLSRKPGALARSLALRQERDRGDWPEAAAMEALIEAHAGELKLPTVKARFRAMAAEATRDQQTPIAYLAALLEAEQQERAERRERRRLVEARFPVMKRLEEFRFEDNPKVPQATIAALAEGSWIDDRESVIFVGESGTGKTMLATVLAVCVCQQGGRVRFTTLAGLANELQEAESEAESRRELGRVVGRYARTELVVLDELGYLALPDGAAELIFQVISERNERGSLMVTTNLPFCEWTKVFADARLAKAVVDRLTHKAHIIETGTESWCFRHGLEKRGAKKKGG